MKALIALGASIYYRSVENEGFNGNWGAIKVAAISLVAMGFIILIALL